MPQYIDTHSHLYVDRFKEDIEAVEARAKSTLSAIFLPNIDLESVDDMHQLSQRDPNFYFPMMGLHPCSVKEDFEEVLAKIEAHLRANTYYGIGETGIDLYWDTTFQEQQVAALQKQIDWAKELDLPIILHCRSALDEVIDLISQNHDDSLRGIFHCFDGTIEHANRIMELGNFKMGIGGILTYKKSKLPPVLSDVPLDFLVLETDSPYLPPTPYRGKRNESSYTELVANKLAELYDCPAEKIAEYTNENARQIFGEVLRLGQ